MKRLLSSEHFGVDGALIQAQTLLKSFRQTEVPGEGFGRGEPPPASVEGFGWMKAAVDVDRPKLRGLDGAVWALNFAGAVYNLVRLPQLLTAPDKRGYRPGTERSPLEPGTSPPQGLIRSKIA